MARKILLADDSVTAQNMGRRILTDAGYEVTTVNNGSAALKKIAESKPDLIVLDVYMPGYGGLEVCQRIRESEETARIPVLLTVGKLEPFKAEEARRVRADAYVVKPFEASELLTALTKLEDKIVPPPQPHKPSRSVVPTAAIEQMSAGKQFGDLETGWKNRLKIPPPHQTSREGRSEDSEPQVEPVHSGRSEAVAQEAKERAPERGASSRMGDITPDEIAAITAAAAAFSAQGEDPFVKLVQAAETKSAVAQEKPEPVAETGAVEMGATFATAPEVPAEAEKESAAMEPVNATPIPAAVTPAEGEVAKAVVADVPPPEIPATQEVESFPPVSEATEKGKLGREEVAAALASLAPVTGRTEAFARAAETQPAPAMLATASSQGFSGPRWAAETVALADDEGALILEQEMIKAQAALAAVAAESASEPRAQFAVAPEENLSLPEAEVSFSPGAPFMGESSPPVLEEPQGLPSAAIAEEPPADAVALQAETPQVDGSTAEVKEEAFAASASAGAAADSISTTDATSHAIAPAEAPEAASPASAPADHHRESELAAAWASWKQVRDSVASPEFTSQIADVAAGLTDVPSSEPASGPELPAEISASAPEENGAIASIVDSVLAELKPKLMEEIAKKIKKDR